jgi:Zn-dependent peptidase ImmA (M78 family)/DNA-binding XRE family transcriptional regulator
MVDINELSMQEVGRRLKLARETAGIRQEKAARIIEVSRPTLVSIEQGSRRVKIKELQILASHYGTSVNALLRREAVHTDLLPRFKKLNDTADGDIQSAVEDFNNLIKADVELENVLGIRRRKNYPLENGISEGEVKVLAAKNAQLLRDHLKIGTGPILDLFSLVEFDLGIRLYQRRLPGKVAGLFTYDDNFGASILINANHPIQRRIQSLAHETGHFDGTRRNPEVLERDEAFLSREERYADAFGRAFLTPAESFTQHFQQLKELIGSEYLTRKLVILLANKFSISREACVRRLEELGLAREGSWQWFEKNDRITIDDAVEVLGEAKAKADDPIKVEASKPMSQRMSLMAHAAWKRELMTEGQLSELLKIGRIELRETLDEIELEEEGDNGFFKLAD